MTKNSIRKEQTDHAISEARSHIDKYVAKLSGISANPDEQLVAQVTTETAEHILLAALQHVQLNKTGSPNVDQNLWLATSIAARQAREAAYQTAHCNITALQMHKRTTEETEEWIHRNAKVLQGAGQAMRDTYRGMLMACTVGLSQDDTGRNARRQTVDIVAHITTVIDTTTNVDAIRERIIKP